MKPDLREVSRVFLCLNLRIVINKIKKVEILKAYKSIADKGLYTNQKK
jgi:hypothetical protein